MNKTVFISTITWECQKASKLNFLHEGLVLTKGVHNSQIMSLISVVVWQNKYAVHIRYQNKIGVILACFKSKIKCILKGFAYFIYSWQCYRCPLFPPFATLHPAPTPSDWKKMEIKNVKAFDISLLTEPNTLYWDYDMLRQVLVENKNYKQVFPHLDIL